jgi:ABC-2 type transport system ATP-binding protein
VFFSTHQISEVERIADEVLVIDKGQLVLAESLDSMRDSYRRIDVTFPACPDTSELLLPGVQNIESHGNHLSIFVSRNSDSVVQRANQFYPTDLQVRRVDLREIFLQAAKGN